jgi:hypothetical protein
MKFLTVLFLNISFFIQTALAQYDEDLSYKSENLVGLDFYTHGGLLGGAVFKKSERKKHSALNAWYVELVHVKHPQEIRFPGSNFIYGKENYLISLRPGLTREYIIFTPAKEEGVQVNSVIGVGLSIGMVKPYYIKYNYSSSRDNPIIKEEPYDPVRHSNLNRIAGRAGFMNGLEDSEFTPGFHLKGGFTFYFGNIERRLTGIEVGTMMEGFFTSGDNLIEPNRIRLLASDNNNWLFTSLYLNLFYAWRK